MVVVPGSCIAKQTPWFDTGAVFVAQFFDKALALNAPLNVSVGFCYYILKALKVTILNSFQ